jgi:hypothetical protein
MRVIRSFCRVTLFLAVALPGSAAGLNGADLNPHIAFSGGGAILTDDHVRDATGASYPIESKNRFQVGISAGVPLVAFLALEAGFRTEQNALRAQVLIDSQIAASVDFSVQQFFFNIVCNTPYSDGGLRLFATGGAGFRRSSHAASSGDRILRTASGSEIAPSFNFGGGLEARGSRRFSIAAEVRDFVGDTPKLIQSYPAEGVSHDIHMSVGLIVHLR